MKVTIRAGNPFYFATFSAALLLIGWFVGARWGHAASAGYALFWAIVTLLVHDLVMAILAGIGGYKFAMYLKNKERR